MTIPVGPAEISVTELYAESTVNKFTDFDTYATAMKYRCQIAQDQY